MVDVIVCGEVVVYDEDGGDNEDDSDGGDGGGTTRGFPERTGAPRRKSVTCSFRLCRSLQLSRAWLGK